MVPMTEADRDPLKGLHRLVFTLLPGTLAAAKSTSISPVGFSGSICASLTVTQMPA